MPHAAESLQVAQPDHLFSNGEKARAARARKTELEREARELHRRLSKNSQLNSAQQLAALVLKSTLQLGDCVPDSETAEASRAHLGAISLGARTWDCLADRIRVLKGEPLPGARKPAPEVPKVKKKAAVAYGGMDA